MNVFLVFSLSSKASSNSSGSLDTGSYYSTIHGMVKSNVRFSSNCIWTITYNAGYQTANIPREIKTANMMLARLLVEAMDAGNLGNPNGGALNEFQFAKFRERYVAGTSITVNDSNLPPTIEKMLKRYKINRSL